VRDDFDVIPTFPLPFAGDLVDFQKRHFNDFAAGFVA
jgi:hypothetical protein